MRTIDSSKPAIGLDIDGTIDEAPELFQTLTKFWPGPIYIITMHSGYPQAILYLQKFNICYDYLFVVASFEEKAKIIKEKNIAIYFDDMDEVIGLIPENVKVMKVRNGGNFYAGKWLYNDKTGAKV